MEKLGTAELNQFQKSKTQIEIIGFASVAVVNSETAAADVLERVSRVKKLTAPG